MTKKSPFATSRFEFESRHVYYLPQRFLTELEDSKPTYLVGSRGTGKTTLLKALTWEERLNNVSLRKQLKEHPFIKRYIGVYLKAPEFQFESFDLWLHSCNDIVYGGIVAYFLDLLWISLAANAISTLMVRKVIPAPPEAEHHAIKEVITENGTHLAAYFHDKGPHTLRDLVKATKDASIQWQNLARTQPDPKTVLDRLPTGQPGDFGRSVAKILCKVCDKYTTGDDWHLKLCVDETEALPMRQQLVLNTIVRLASWPMFPILSYVSLPEELNRCLIPSLTLQKADRHLKVLDDMTDADFRDLAVGVARVRVRHYLRRPHANIDLDRILGHWNVNILLEARLRESANQWSAQLLEKAQAMTEHPFFKDKVWSPESIDSDGTINRALPIYQTYLIDRLGLKLPSPKDARWKHRAQESAELRKRLVAAYLSICAECGLDVRYASAEVLLQMSDKCTRDFLAQMEAIYRASKKSVANLLTYRMPYPLQAAPLKDASLAKKGSLVKSGVRIPTETGRLVDGLARITAIVQTSGSRLQHLKSSERGIFELDVRDGNGKQIEEYVRLINDAAEAGFVRCYAADGRTLRFRVHTSLAAAYGFSYRGAYYPIRLAWSDVERLLSANAKEEHDKAVTEIGRRTSGQDEDDLPLFANMKGS